MKLFHVALAAALLSTRPAQAGISTDGTLGTKTTLTGPNYAIADSYGQIEGKNLFHSFSRFDLAIGESATFGGPANIQNIISRVTGPGASGIDGKISSTISGANLYLVNPRGIVFGPNATLDVSGSFYATSADYLKLGPAGRFDASIPANTLLRADPPSAFGFLGPNPASIAVIDSSLSVPRGTLTFVGGDVTITREHSKSENLLFSPGGFNLVSVGSAGEAGVTGAKMDTSSFSRMGTATVERRGPALTGAESLDINTSTGGIYISSGSLIVDGAYMASSTTGGATSGDLNILASDVWIKNGAGIITYSNSVNGKAGDIDITASGPITVSGSQSRITSTGTESGNSGSVALTASTVTLEDSASITVNPLDDSGKGGDLHITSEILSVGSQSQIKATAGTVTINTGTLTMSDGSISALASRKGNGGDLVINARDSVYLSEKSYIGADGKNAGNVTIDAANAVTVDGSYIYVGNWSGTNNADNRISARDITIINGGRISSISNETKAGDIEITATGRLRVSGIGSLIRSNSLGDKDAGKIAISAARVLVDGGGAIETWVGNPEKPGLAISTLGNGGSININASESVTVSGRAFVDGQWVPSKIDVSTKGKGNAGILTIKTPYLHLADGAEISSNAFSEGNAGSITLDIRDLLTIDAGAITTDAANATGGNITIDPVLAYLRNASISTSVNGGMGNGGNISLAAGSIVLEQSDIKADAHGGNGGSVHITSDVFLADPVSRVTASSELGLPGTVDISAPLVDVSGNLVLLPEGMLNDDDLAPRTCAVSDDSSSSFIMGSSPLQSRPPRNLMAF